MNPFPRVSEAALFPDDSAVVAWAFVDTANTNILVRHNVQSNMAANRFFHIFFLLISLNFMYWIDIVKLYNELSWAVYANSEFILREICEWLQMLMAFTS